MCTCASCKYTDSFTMKGFAAWPVGDGSKTARQSAAEYSAHVAHSFFGARKTAAVGPSGAAWYGTSPGMTRAEVEAVLREQFARTPDPEPVEQSAPVVEISTAKRRSSSLIHLARDLRAQARRAA